MIVGVSGKARSGKDSLYSLAVRDGWHKLSFALALKERAQLDWSLPWSAVDGEDKDVPTECLNGHTPREFLVDLGNLYRKYDPDYWIDKALMNTISDLNFMVTDVRFPNEAEAIKAKGGKLIRLERHPSRDHLVDDRTKAGVSETALDAYTGWDYVLLADKNHTMDDLKRFWETIKGEL